MAPRYRPQLRNRGFRLLSLVVFVIFGQQSLFAQESAASGSHSPGEFAAALEIAQTLPRLHSLLISHDGETLVEEYLNGRGPSSVANVKSVSKSVISALVGIAISRGDIEGVDQPIGDFFGDRLSRSRDDGKRRITVGDLLTMQSGLETTSNRNYGAWVNSRDWVGFALAQPLERPPGSLMEYSTGNTHLLSAILTIATGMSTLAFARESLGDPLGFHVPGWPRDPQGIYFGGNDMEFTPRQMLRFGELYINDGRADGRQIIPAEWVRASLEPKAISTREPGRYYGYGWWYREMAGLEVPYAWGYGGQFIILAPEVDLVVVATSSSYPSDERRPHLRRLMEMIEHYVVALFLDTPGASRLTNLR